MNRSNRDHEQRVKPQEHRIGPEQAGLDKGTVYLYFKSKEELFLGLTDRLLAAWLDELDQFLRQPAHQSHDKVAA